MSTVPTPHAEPNHVDIEKPGIKGLVVAVLAMAILLVAPTPDGLTAEGQRMAALFVLIILLWVTEALPIAITSLLALALQPILGLNTLGAAGMRAGRAKSRRGVG